ncbi:DoxX family membrane protein [Mucilaginibacter celer]|uniref:DoxX family membrane protein n=1 Tax=Mucilaginibacter celer TaxID=2305508 RepID=A0A494VMF0_9SPHI|nr:DoxX family membrane protein [Mucilaginibacter celer]AYL95814.1 DoxX family membrane protein [Mucilaginibacter celer]
MKKIILFVLCLLTGLMFINAGLNKFFNYMPVPKDMPAEMMKVFQAYMTIGWLMPLVGAAEVVGGLLLIIPVTRALGAVILVPILTGILLANISTSPSALPISLIMAAVVVWVIIDNREKYLPMIRK